jgi:GTPase
MASRSAPPTPEPALRAGRVVLVGCANVGKSTLLNALVGEPIAITSPHPQTTRSLVRGVLTTRDTQYVFVDTPGLHDARTSLGERMNAISRGSLQDADAVVVVVEAPRSSSASVNERDASLATELEGPRSVLVVNKVDRLDDKASLLPAIESLVERRRFAAVVPISARRKDGLDRLLAEIRKLLPLQPFPFEADTLSDQPTRFFAAEFVREQILARLKQEVPHGVAVVIDHFDESREVPRIEATAYVARAAHKKILVGAGGQMIKRIGTAARGRIERMLGRKVNLQLWVRASPGWMDDERRLRELGYGPGDDGG